MGIPSLHASTTSVRYSKRITKLHYFRIMVHCFVSKVSRNVPLTSINMD